MKFVVAGLLALVACVQSSAILPYAAWPQAAPWAHQAGITQYASLPYAHVAHAPISYANHVAAPLAYSVAAPHAYSVAAHHAYASHAVPVAHHALPVAHAATYTAANRGSVHTAPLPGHVLSQTSLNVAPAPGTY